MIPHRLNIFPELPPALEKRLKLIEALARHTAARDRARQSGADEIAARAALRETVRVPGMRADALVFAIGCDWYDFIVTSSHVCESGLPAGTRGSA